MSQSTDGEISFGVLFVEDYEFPWYADGKGGDIDDWWRNEQGYKASIAIWDDKGDYIGGVRPAQEVFDRYFDERKKFMEDKPLPVVEVNYCSGDYPMYILAVPSSVRKCHRGGPTEFNPLELTVSMNDAQALVDFCIKYGLKFEHGPGWFLSSYWG